MGKISHANANATVLGELGSDGIVGNVSLIRSALFRRLDWTRCLWSSHDHLFLFVLSFISTKVQETAKIKRSNFVWGKGRIFKIVITNTKSMKIHFFFFFFFFSNQKTFLPHKTKKKSGFCRGKRRAGYTSSPNFFLKSSLEAKAFLVEWEEVRPSTKSF